MLNWLKWIWYVIKPDPYACIESIMAMEGYTDFEIALEIATMKEAERKRQLQDDTTD